MEATKIEKNKLYSIQDYAKLNNVTRQTVYNWLKYDVKNYELKLVIISGKKFIQV